MILFAIGSFILGKFPWFKTKFASLKKKLVAKHASSCEEDDECHHSHGDEESKEK